MVQKNLYIRAIKDKMVQEGTGKNWEEWFKILDDWGAQEKRHAVSAKHLREEYGLNAWWSHAVAFRYEWERGLR